jgi:uncharacterized membrane-anchored protein YjiN (DUF445 family)
MNKSVLTNLVAAGLVGAGLTLSGPAQPAVLNMGLFALAGGVTNWLAIHMLFEKVPGLYGSGVIVERFDDFKTGIHSLIMEQFFSQQNIERFFAELTDDQQHQLDFTDIIEQTDLEPTYTSLVESVMESSFGSMLGMFGGEAALEPLKEPFIAKMKNSLNDMAHSESFQASVREKLSSGPVTDDITQQIEHIVQSRLAELTPNMVKEIIQTMIREHLGWLVVWGGVFGSLIGLITSFINF